MRISDWSSDVCASDLSARLLGVLDERLASRDWVMGDDYSIADISLLGWVRNLIGFYEAAEIVGFERFGEVRRWLDAGLARPGVQRGLEVRSEESRVGKGWVSTCRSRWSPYP